MEIFLLIFGAALLVLGIGGFLLDKFLIKFMK